VRFLRVQETQSVSVNGKPPSAQAFAAQYRVESQPDGRWLVGADGGGG
jgi:hypothetical protein